MQSFFYSGWFAANRRRLLTEFTGTAPIVVTANGLLQRLADSTYPFAQDANFWYLTGIDQPDIVLVMDKGEEYLIVPSRSANRQAFDGNISAEALTKTSGIKQVYEAGEGWALLEKRLKKVKHVAALAPPPPYIEQYGMYTNPARSALGEKLINLNNKIEFVDIGQYLAVMRMIKQSEEIKVIQAAIDLTANAIKNISKPSRLKRYSHEYAIEADLTQYYRSHGADGHGFEPIVASGRNACTLHYIENNDPLSADELVLIDTGALVDHFSADITRTISIGQPSPRQQAVHQAVLDVQDYAMGLLKPGVLLKEYEKKIEDRLGKHLVELGLINASDHDKIRQYYPHAASHFLGLNVHDVADYSRPLEPGMVLTVEPGIYIPEENIGVRIEDNVLVTEKGIKILSHKLPRGLE